MIWSLTVTTRAQKFYMGECPVFDPIHNFELNRYMGVWYQIASTRDVLKENPDCVEHRYSAGKNGSFNVLTKLVSIATNGPTKLWGIAKPYQYYGLPLNSDYELTIYGDAVNTTTPYVVLSTDYCNYSIVWSCTENIFFNIHTVEVLARQRDPDFAMILSKTFEVLIRAELDFLFDYLFLTQQFMCVIIPPIPTSTRLPFINRLIQSTTFRT